MPVEHHWKVAGVHGHVESEVFYLADDKRHCTAPKDVEASCFARAKKLLQNCYHPELTPVSVTSSL